MNTEQTAAAIRDLPDVDDELHLPTMFFGPEGRVLHTSDLKALVERLDELEAMCQEIEGFVHIGQEDSVWHSSNGKWWTWRFGPSTAINKCEHPNLAEAEVQKGDCACGCRDYQFCPDCDESMEVE